MKLLPNALSELQAQFNRELQNSQVYLALAGACEFLNLSGFARFMHKQADEERTHARHFFDYLSDIGEQPQVQALEAVNVTVGGDAYASVLDMFLTALAAEQQNLESLYAVQQAAGGDPATVDFLIPIIIEQISSIKEFSEWVTKVTLAQGNGAALFALEHEFGEGD